MKYPVYRTKKGRLIPAYVAVCVGKTFDLGPDGMMRGKDGVIGYYTTGEAAIVAAASAKSETCNVRVTNTRTGQVIYKA